MTTVHTTRGSRLVCGDGNGSWLQYSCLEDGTDREAWWAAVYEVAQGSDTTKAA